ncbi:hypothetical protein K469DRAFT_19713 [Zopfia rhizophila CBS 207.26]|uniref:Uncharacterized protein n=1 Tax=Zopfia rhizophila CBS 207.26 TaxID=1314779 RepID=A0A6A6EWA1_9PEZI|nr:hypothetical protein K469DRAFT_19713 [Zopfia rhizophila CBS 207.26]
MCVCVCVCVCSIMAMHPRGMGRYNAPAIYILHSLFPPFQKPTMRPAHPPPNTMLNIGNKRDCTNLKELKIHPLPAYICQYP